MRRGGLVSKSVVQFNLPYNKQLVSRAKDLRKSRSLPEALLWCEIKGGKINGLDFDRQKIIGNYIIDFFVLSVQVIHISAKEVLKNSASVAELLRNIL